MKVVSCYKAAQMAGVSRQVVHQMKKINSEIKGRYDFFRHDPINGKLGVDVDSQNWQFYIDSRQAKKKATVDNTVGHSTNHEQSESVNTDAMVKAIQEAFVEIVGSDKMLDKYMRSLYGKYATYKYRQTNK